MVKQHSTGRLKHCVFTVRACVPVYSEGVRSYYGNKVHYFGGRGLVERRVFLDTSRRLYLGGRWTELSGRRVETHAGVDVASAVDVINDLGFDTLTFLMVTVIIVPAFRVLKASPVLTKILLGGVLVYNLLLVYINVFVFLMVFGRFLVSSLLVLCSINLVSLEISQMLKYFRNGGFFSW